MEALATVTVAFLVGDTIQGVTGMGLPTVSVVARPPGSAAIGLTLPASATAPIPSQSFGLKVNSPKRLYRVLVTPRH